MSSATRRGARRGTPAAEHPSFAHAHTVAQLGAGSMAAHLDGVGAADSIHGHNDAVVRCHNGSSNRAAARSAPRCTQLQAVETATGIEGGCVSGNAYWRHLQGQQGRTGVHRGARTCSPGVQTLSWRSRQFLAVGGSSRCPGSSCPRAHRVEAVLGMRWPQTCQFRSKGVIAQLSQGDHWGLPKGAAPAGGPVATALARRLPAATHRLAGLPEAALVAEQLGISFLHFVCPA